MIWLMSFIHVKKQQEKNSITRQMRMVSGKSEPSKIIINFQYKLILVVREYTNSIRPIRRGRLYLNNDN